MITASNGLFPPDATQSFTIEIAKAMTTLANAPSPGGPLGTKIKATASLSGGGSPGGQVTFSLYGPGNASCSGAAVFADTVPVAGNGDYASAEFKPPTKGDYRWQVSYSGDANNANSAAACSDPVTLADVTAPETKINVKPKYQANRDTRIRFKSDDPDAAFECKLDKGKWKTCASPISYKKLKPGKHTFYVRATDSDSNTDPTPAKASFKVKKPKR